MTATTTRRIAAADVDVAASILAAGGTVAMPTETVYGLAADAASDAAVAKIFAAKGRPAGHPLIVHVASPAAVSEWADTSDPLVAVLADAFWPGPLTLILPRNGKVSDLVVGGRETVGVRVPDHPVASALLTAFAAIGSGGVAAPSANRFGHVSPTTAQHVVDDLDGRIDAVIDAGPSSVGVESTILELVGPEPTLLRPGGVPRSALEAALGVPVLDGRRGPSRAAGMMASHYAPRAEVVVVSAGQVGDLDDLRGAGERGDAARDERPVAVVGPVDERDVGSANGPWLREDSVAYARGLYDALRAADALDAVRIYVVPPSGGPLVDAVLDRLAKAASPR